MRIIDCGKMLIGSMLVVVACGSAGGPTASSRMIGSAGEGEAAGGAVGASGGGSKGLDMVPDAMAQEMAGAPSVATPEPTYTETVSDCPWNPADPQDTYITKTFYNTTLQEVLFNVKVIGHFKNPLSGNPLKTDDPEGGWTNIVPKYREDKNSQGEAIVTVTVACLYKSESLYSPVRFVVRQ